MNTRPIGGTSVQKQIGDLFLRARCEKGVSQKQIADGMRRSINTVRWHEAGARSFRADDLVLAAEIIGCSPLMLLPDMGGTDPRDRFGWLVDTPPLPREEEQKADGGEDGAATAA